MKKVLIVSLLLSVFCLSFPILVSLAGPIRIKNVQENEAVVTDSPEVSPPAHVSPEAEYVFEDDDIQVKVFDGENVKVMTMAQYLIGVVAAEMPAVFEIEALRAQAVAARTITLYHMLCYKPDAHPDADVCTDFTCCQAYASNEELREKWGVSFDAYLEKVTQSVRSTDGECLAYGNEPIQAVFHSSSAGLTAESGEVWAYSPPYLVSVNSPETPDNVPNYVSSVTVSLTDFKETVLKFYPDAVFPKDSSTWITDITHTKSGRIGTLKLGGVTVSGPILRNVFGLRSTAVSIKIGNNNIIFTTTGYGHGVGMSQYGANAFALQGKSYKDILSWYYTGVSFARAKYLMKS